MTYFIKGSKINLTGETFLFIFACAGSPVEVWISGVYHRDRVSGCSRLGYGISPLGGGRHSPHHRAARTYTGLGNRLLEGTNRTLCPGPRRKEQWPHKKLTQTCLWVSRTLQCRRGLVLACCRVGGPECSSTCMGSFEGGHHNLHYLHHSLAPGKLQEGNTAPPINRILD